MSFSNRLAAVPAALVLALGAAACGGDEELPIEEPIDTAANNNGEDVAEPSEPVGLDLIAAGGACPLIDSELLEAVTGEEFRFASGWPNDDEPADEEGENEDGEEPDPGVVERVSCAIQTGDGMYPDLTFVLYPTEVSDEVYVEELSDRATELEDLGEAAYWIVHTEDTGAGPSMEMGWLDVGFLFELRYTAATETEPDVVEAMIEGFAGLAADINAAFAEAGGGNGDSDDEE
jgi:hypothetical protein